MPVKFDDMGGSSHFLCKRKKYTAAFGGNNVDFNTITGFQNNTFVNKLMLVKVMEHTVQITVPG